MKKYYTISVLTEDKAGLLTQITILFTRRKINIESLNVSSSEVKGISRFTIVSKGTREQIDKLCLQIRKLIEVVGAFVYDENEIYYQEIALYKVSTKSFLKNKHTESLIRSDGARILVIEKDYIIIEKTGRKEETHDLYCKLEPYGILEFVRSGRVSLSKSGRKTEDYIHELEKSKSNTLTIKDY